MARQLNATALPSLVLVTDDERLPDPCAAALLLPRGSLILLRARRTARREELAQVLGRIARSRGLFVLVANDPGLACRADGMHFPEARVSQLGYWRARRSWAFLTASAHSLRAVVRAARCGADAVFLSPVFSTESHPGRIPLTPMRVRMMARITNVPLYAMGGIHAENVKRLAGARLAGIAAIGALAP